MLELAGRHTTGTITWMVGPKTLSEHILPVIGAAATAAGRPTPRAIYGQLPSYRAMLDREGLARPEDFALIGDEAQLRGALHRLRDLGATDFNAAIADVEPGAFDRTFDFIASVRAELRGR